MKHKPLYVIHDVVTDKPSDNDGLVWSFTTLKQARKARAITEKIVKYEVVE